MVSPVMLAGQTFVLGKATQHAAEGLGISGKDLALTVGLSESTVSLILSGERGIDPDSKEGQLSLMLIRVFHALDAMVGGDEAKRQSWMNSRNVALNGVPAALALTPEGLARTLVYLEGMWSLP